MNDLLRRRKGAKRPYSDVLFANGSHMFERHRNDPCGCSASLRKHRTELRFCRNGRRPQGLVAQGRATQELPMANQQQPNQERERQAQPDRPDQGDRQPGQERPERDQERIDKNRDGDQKRPQ